MKNKLKKFLLMLLVNSFSLFSCGKNSSRIGIFIYDETDTFIGTLNNNIRNELNENKLDYGIYYASRSQTKQNEQVTQAIESNSYAILLLNLVDRLAGNAIMDKAALYDLPLVFFNREPLSSDLIKHENTYYVGSNPQVEGILQAYMVESLFGSPTSLNEKYDKNGDGTIQLILLRGEQGHQDSEERSKYSIGQLRDDGYNIDILESFYCNWQRDKAKEVTRELYEIDNYTNDDIELIISNNDDMALGAIDYLLEKDLFLSDAEDVSMQPYPIIGVDATSVGLEAIKKNCMYGTVKNDALEQATAIVTLTDYILNKLPIDASFPFEFESEHKIYIRGTIVTKADITD